MNKKANFFIVGAAKSGTTSLFHYLPQHPQIFFPKNIKEPAYFSYEFLNFPMKRDHISKLTLQNWWGVSTLEQYEAIYNEAKDEKILGDASIEYLMLPQCAKKIKAYNPEAKIFICLRDPAERAYSHYMQNIRDNFETLSFAEAVSEEVEKQRKLDNFAYRYWYKEMGNYANQVKTYLDVFGKENVMVILYEDLLQNEEDILAKICSFLKIDSYTFETGSNFNLSGRVKNRSMYNLTNRENILKKILRPIIPTQLRHKIAHNLNKKNIVKEKMNPEARTMLKAYFKEDIQALEKIIDRDCSKWYQ